MNSAVILLCVEVLGCIVKRKGQYLEIHNKHIIIHTTEHFDNYPLIDAIVVFVRELIEYLNNLLYKFRIGKVKTALLWE